ncbi:MAG: DUF4136 domain-containing protein [Cyclobacteriaceae bacterium]|nr:DUF4136 domain-containing protein [Cyclobacteriaceae bacterium]
MAQKILIIWLMVLAFCAQGQEFKVEYDKKHDFTRYKTFSFGESEIVIPADQRTAPDAQWHDWMKKALQDEFAEKGLAFVEKDGDLVISYIIGSVSRTEVQNLGPMGMAPGADQSRLWNRDFKQGSIIIDLNNRQGFKVWRVTATTHASVPDAERQLDQLVGEGFRKFSIKPKKSKKK